MTSVKVARQRAVLAEIRLSRWVDRLTREGGFTVSPRTGEYVTSGYAVSTHPECERQIQGRVTVDDLRDFAYTHASALMVDGSVFGAWRDRETGLSYVDVSTVVHDRAEALRLARVHNQLAVFDLARGVEIRA